MHDPRIDKLAKVLVNYSAAVEKDDLVRISGGLPGMPLYQAIYEHTLRAGGHPFLMLASEACRDAFYRLATDEQLQFLNPVSMFIMENVDVSLSAWADENTRTNSNVPSEKQTMTGKANKPVMKTMMDRAAKKELRWCGTQFPTLAAAQDAEMSLHEYEEFVFNAGLLHLPDPVAGWKAVSEKQQRLVDVLMKVKEIRVISESQSGKTDLKVGVEGRTWINCDGRVNFPDGEVFTGPIETATEGTIHYSFPAVHGGRECHDISLTFKAGKVIDAHAKKGEEFLLKMLDQDAGSRTLGEFAIGTNFGITRYTKNTLFDEKIGGTCHAALGAAYPDSGGKNESALHWDMVCDLRTPGSQILADGKLLLQDGRFVNPDFPNP